jgi:hypothetical protein
MGRENERLKREPETLRGYEAGLGLARQRKGARR